METTIDLIITCMGRLDHLKLSLPQALKQSSTSCFLVDYSCPEHCSEWAEQQGYQITSIKVTNQQIFNLSTARNAGARAGKSPWLLFIDADIILADDFSQKILNLFQPGYSYHPFPEITGSKGTFICQRKDFFKLGGYDEIIQGWGCEDTEFYSRLSYYGVKKDFFPSSLLTNIPHNDQLRSQNYAEKNIWRNHISNQLYLTGTQHIASLTGSWPDKKLRSQLYVSASNTVKENDPDNPFINTAPSAKDKSLRIQLGAQIIRGIKISSELQYHIEKQPDQFSKTQNTGFTISETIKTIQERWSGMVSSSAESPLFILSSGFRSGSTLLQRMFFKQCWIWGEPYASTGLLDHLITPFLHLNQSWPPDNYISSPGSFENPQHSWIANLYPEPNHLMTAAQHYLEALFKTPAMHRGYAHWGFKDVRLSGEHACFLHWLYPHAHFLFLIRNPYNAYKSYRQFLKPWYLRKPDQLVDSVEKFGHHWLNTSKSFLLHTATLNARVLQYEQIISPDFDWTETENYAGFEVDKSALKLKIKGSNPYPEQPIEMEQELHRLTEIVNPLANQLGYKLSYS